MTQFTHQIIPQSNLCATNQIAHLARVIYTITSCPTLLNDNTASRQTQSNWNQKHRHKRPLQRRPNFTNYPQRNRNRVHPIRSTAATETSAKSEIFTRSAKHSLASPETKANRALPLAFLFFRIHFIRKDGFVFLIKQNYKQNYNNSRQQGRYGNN